MPEALFNRAVVPIASPDDAAATARALRPFVDDPGSTVIGVHVVEKAGGGLDKASVQQREEHAAEAFIDFTGTLAETGATVETDILYGTDIAETIIEGAHERDASAIVFTPRGESRWKKLLSGDVTHKLVANSDIPILVVPDRAQGIEEQSNNDGTNS